MNGIFGLKCQYNVKPTLGIWSSKFIIFKSQETNQNILFSHIRAHKILMYLFKIENKFGYNKEV